MTVYSISEAAAMLAVSVPVLRREISRKKLVARKFGGRMYVMEADLFRYIDLCSTGEAEAEPSKLQEV